MSKKNYVDYSEVYKAINKTEKLLTKNMLKAVEEGGKYGAQALKKRTPTAKDDANREHAKNHIVHSKPTVAKPYSEVGFDKEVAWRMHFVEFGTIKQRPKGFIQKTIKDIESEVADIIQNYMRKGLDK